MPMTRPALSSSGPPELPGLMAASVWITPWIGRFVAPVISRPRPLMMPVVSVWSKPKGLPMANTFWPTCRFVDVPIGIGGSRRLRGVDLQDGDVLVRIGPDEPGLPRGLIRQGHLNRLGFCDHVVVRHDIAVLVPDESGAGALRDLQGPAIEAVLSESSCS